MRRRQFIVLFGMAALAWPQAARAQQRAKVPRIGYLHTPPLATRESQLIREAFWHGMRALGWVEGQNILVEYRSAEGKLDRFPELAAELVRLKVDLILAGPQWQRIVAVLAPLGCRAILSAKINSWRITSCESR